MADGPDPGALNVRILSDELSTVSDWYQLGIKLGVPDYKLDEIQRSHSTEGCGRWRVEALSLWLRCTPNSSWNSVVRALQQLGENTLAEALQKKYIRRRSTPTSHITGHPTAPHVTLPTLLAASVSPPSSHQILQTHSVHSIEEDSGAVAIARENRQNINWKFGVLLKNSCKKLREKHLNITDFRLFLKGLFPPGDCVPESSNVDEIFEAITRNMLWNYWNCSPLQKVVQEFVGDDQEMKSWIETYKKDLMSYKAMTRLVDYIKMVESDPSSDDSSSDEKQAPAKYDPQYYRKLSIKLEATFTSHTLEYLDDLWKEFAALYNLPQLGTLLDCVCKRSVLIVWLIPAHLTHHILRTTPGSFDIFRKHQITRVEFGGVCIYPETKQHSEGIQPANQAEIFLHHTSLSGTKQMEEMARENTEIEQLQTQLKTKTEESERKIQDLEAGMQYLRQQLFQEGEQLQQDVNREAPLVGTVLMAENEAGPEKGQQLDPHDPEVLAFRRLVYKFSLKLSKEECRALVYIRLYDCKERYRDADTLEVLSRLETDCVFSPNNPEGLIGVAKDLGRKDLKNMVYDFIRKKTRKEKGSLKTVKKIVTTFKSESSMGKEQLHLKAILEVTLSQAAEFVQQVDILQQAIHVVAGTKEQRQRAAESIRDAGRMALALTESLHEAQKELERSGRPPPPADTTLLKETTAESSQTRHSLQPKQQAKPGVLLRKMEPTSTKASLPRTSTVKQPSDNLGDNSILSPITDEGDESLKTGDSGFEEAQSIHQEVSPKGSEAHYYKSLRRTEASEDGDYAELQH